MNVSCLDRRGPLRDDVIKQLAANRTRVFVWHKGCFLFYQGSPVFWSLQDCPAESADPGPVYLGRYQDWDYLAQGVTSPDEVSGQGEFVNLRAAGRGVDEFTFELLFYAQGLLNWHSRNRFCARCGSPGEAGNAGHWRRCTGAGCGRTYYPKLDPAVIFSITRVIDQKPRILLARKPEWDASRRSVIAGFVEPGERLEDAVRREAWEETGLRVDAVEYAGSQPWPFPDALMVGFTCTATDREITLIDGELESATWYSVGQIEAGLRDASLSMPYRQSIAWHLVDRWFSEQTGISLDTFDPC
jgi:NAD+ diphosphatase